MLNPNRSLDRRMLASLSALGFQSASFLLPASCLPLRLVVARYAFYKGCRQSARQYNGIVLVSNDRLGLNRLRPSVSVPMGCGHSFSFAYVCAIRGFLPAALLVCSAGCQHHASMQMRGTPRLLSVTTGKRHWRHKHIGRVTPCICGPA